MKLSERVAVRGSSDPTLQCDLARIERAAALVHDQSALLKRAFLDAWIHTYAASIGAGNQAAQAQAQAAGAVAALNQYLQAERKP
jgi:hypothetical protein